MNEMKILKSFKLESAIPALRESSADARTISVCVQLSKKGSHAFFIRIPIEAALAGVDPLKRPMVRKLHA